MTLPLAPLSILLYVGFEWLFMVTKPSPTGSLLLAERVLVLLRAPLPLLLPVIGIQAAASLLAGAVYPRGRGLAVVPAAVVLGVLLLLLIDNFTYTLFGAGVLTAGPFLRKAYAMLAAILVAIAGWKLLSVGDVAVDRRGVVAGALGVTALLAVAPQLMTAVIARPAPDDSAPPVIAGSPDTSALPNILFLGIDGVESPILSAYGYERPTTPFLESIREETLFFENAFSNVSRTHGSLVTLLTGRLPFATRVTFPPTVLQRDDAHRHLPGLLRRLGYTTLQLGMRHYADAEDANLREAFDAANYRWQRLDDRRTEEQAADEADAFRAALVDRVQDRFQQIFGFGYVASGFAHVTGEVVEPLWKDQRRVETFERYIQTAPGPWFVHMHLLDTHCCNYQPDDLSFSDGASRALDARDSEILETDANIRRIFEALEAGGLLDRTIIVISSDHTPGWTTTGRVPLMMRFPHGRLQGRVSANVQLADVAPTVLTFMDIEVPAWMDGVSLVGPTSPTVPRPIFGVADVTGLAGAPTERTLLDSGAPNYGVASVSLVSGHEWFEMSLAGGGIRSGAVSGHTRPGVPVPEREARALLLDRIASAGFVVTP